MAGGRFEAVLERTAEPARFGHESVSFGISTHPKQAPGPLSRVASGGELARVALAIQVAASEVGNVPTLVFDEVDTGIGGAVAATVGRMLQSLGERRQVLCVTHLPQVAAHERACATGRQRARGRARANAGGQRDHDEDSRARTRAVRAASAQERALKARPRGGRDWISVAPERCD